MSTKDVLNLYVFNEIDHDKAEDVIKKIKEADFKKIKTINIDICSPGGDIYATFAMLSILEEIIDKYGVTVNTNALGQASSGGFFLFILGHNRRIYPLTRLFVHEHVTYSNGYTYEEQKNNMKEEKELYKLYLEYVSRSLELDINDSKTLLRKNKYLSEKDIKKYKLVNKEY